MEKRYEYLVCFDGENPRLIRLGPWETMEADLFAYPGVWKNTPHLNDIRVGLGCYMDYDDISEKEATEIMGKLQDYYDRIGNEEKAYK